MPTILQTIQEILPDVEIDVSGVVSFTRASVCRVLSLPDYGLTPSRQPKKLAEKLSELGFQDLRPGDYLSDTMVAVIIEYYAFDAQNINPVAVQLYRAFAAVGIRVYFQEAKGWKLQENSQPPVRLTEQLDMLVEAYSKMRNYTANKPGLNSVVNSVLNDEVAALPGLMPLCQLLGERWDSLDMGQRVYLSRAVADTYKATYLKPAAVAIVPIKTRSGKTIKRPQSIYPVDFMPLIECCYAQTAERYNLR